MDCGTYYSKYLPGTLEQGLITEQTLDQSLARPFSSLIRAGYFDPPPKTNPTATSAGTA